MLETVGPPPTRRRLQGPCRTPTPRSLVILYGLRQAHVDFGSRPLLETVGPLSPLRRILGPCRARKARLLLSGSFTSGGASLRLPSASEASRLASRERRLRCAGGSVTLPFFMRSFAPKSPSGCGVTTLAFALSFTGDGRLQAARTVSPWEPAQCNEAPPGPAICFPLGTGVIVI